MEILVLALLTLLNGFFALSEIAIISARKTRLEHQAQAGNKKAQVVLELRREPEDFLSAVQVGITLIGIISGAYGGITFAEKVRPWLTGISFVAPYAHQLSIAIVVAVITYFSIVFGELIPKTIALGNAEKIALAVAPLVKIFTRVTLPLVKLLSVSTHFIIWVFHLKNVAEDKVSVEDLSQLLRIAGKQGVLAKGETELHQNLFNFSRQQARIMQTHRKDLEWIDINASLEEIKAQIRDSIHSKFPVFEGTPDNLIGVLTAKDFYEYLEQPDQPLRSILRKPFYIPETMVAGSILNSFRNQKQYLGIVVDEFGAVEGIVTIHDLLEGIVGELPDLEEVEEPDMLKRSNENYLVNAAIPIYDLNYKLQQELIRNDPGNYTTLAGFITFCLNRVPKVGEKLSGTNYELEVVDMDGFKIDKVILKIFPAKSGFKEVNDGK